MKLMAMVSLLLAVTLAGCSGSSNSDICGTQDDQGRYVVCMTGAFTFEPKNLEVPVGATVVWVQQSSTPHDTEADNGAWKSPFLREKGEEFAHTFEEAGTYDYRCNPHVSQGMVGTITVA